MAKRGRTKKVSNWTFEDDVEHRYDDKGMYGYQSVHPVTRRATGPVRGTSAEAFDDDKVAVEKGMHKTEHERIAEEVTKREGKPVDSKYNVTVNAGRDTGMGGTGGSGPGSY